MDPLKTLTSRTLRRGAPLTVQKQWGGEGGLGLLGDLLDFFLICLDLKLSNTRQNIILVARSVWSRCGFYSSKDY